MKKPRRKKKTFKQALRRQKRTTKSRSRKGVDPLWDLDRDGVTYSFLAKFLNCPERTRLAYVEGLGTDTVDYPLEFGNAFHSCLEYIQDPRGSIEGLERHTNNYAKTHIRASTPKDIEEKQRILGVTEVIVTAYSEWWAKNDKEKQYILSEETFEEPITIPSGRTLKLRGRWDGVFQDERGFWLQENKTKGNIDEEYIRQMLHQDLQTMLYCTTLRRRIGGDPVGVLYNVIRRPGLKPRQNESLKDFVTRVREDIAKRPEWYFMRWTIDFAPGDLDAWIHRSLHPLLQRVCDWWDSIKADPTNVDYVFRDDNAEHFQRPLGIYDSVGSGQRGDFFRLITTGNDYGLMRRDVPFPELEDD